MSYYEITSLKFENIRWQVDSEQVTKTNKHVIRKYIDGVEKPEIIELNDADFEFLWALLEAKGNWRTAEAMSKPEVSKTHQACKASKARIGNKDKQFRALLTERSRAFAITDAKIELLTADGKRFDQKLADESRKRLSEYKDIDPLLLPEFKTDTGKSMDLYAELLNKDRIKVYIYAPGGSGKTYTLVNFSKSLLDKDKGIVPVFIPCKYLLAGSETPIIDYICSNYACLFVDNSEQNVNKTDMLMHLNRYLKATNQKVVIILDGINENPDVIGELSNIDGIIPDCSVIVTSRNMIGDSTKIDWTDYMKLQLQGLSLDQIRKYIASKNIEVPADMLYDQSVLSSPMFLRMFAENMTDCRNISDTLSQADIMDAWISSQNIARGEKFNPVLEWFLPVFALVLYDMTGACMSISFDNKVKAIEKTISILNDENIRTYMSLYGYEVDQTPLTMADTGNFINRAACGKLAILQQSVSDEKLYWHHEHFRDFFAAKGLVVLHKFGKESYYNDYISKFMNKNFKYPDVFERNDYSAYTVANHFCEMLRNTLIKDASEDINIYNMIRNIIYYADDLGYTDTVLRYAKCELKVNETASYLDDFDIANTSNGVACTLLKIRNLDSRDDARDIIDKAQSLLNKTEEILKTIYPNVYEVNVNIAPEVDKMSAEELVLYFKEMNKEIPNVDKKNIRTFSEIAKMSVKELKLYLKEIDREMHSLLGIDNNDNKKYLELYSRWCGNRGLLYLTKYFVGKNTEKKKNDEYLKDAYNYHLFGALYKYCLYAYSEHYFSRYPYADILGELDKAKDRFVISLLSLGTDMYYMHNYKRSIKFYEFAAKWSTKDSTKPRALSYMFRSQVADYSENSSEYSKQDILKMLRTEEDALELYTRYRMRSQIDRVAAVTKTFIDVYKKFKINGNNDEDIDDELVSLAKSIDCRYAELYVTSNALPEVEKYLMDHE